MIEPVKNKIEYTVPSHIVVHLSSTSIAMTKAFDVSNDEDKQIV
jgi:hypothetical protein